MYPKDLKKRANVNRWLLWESSVWFGSCYVGHPCGTMCMFEKPKYHLTRISQRITKNRWSALMHPSYEPPTDFVLLAIRYTSSKTL
jgi:hypothetical protein